MNRKHVIAVAAVLSLGAGIAAAQSDQRQPSLDPSMQREMGESARKVGVSKAEMEQIASGWSAKKELMNKNVTNDQNEKIGKIEDLIITADNSVSFAIVGVGGFLGMGRHDVAIPIKQLKMQDKAFVLPGATKDALKALPKFEYQEKRAAR